MRIYNTSNQNVVRVRFRMPWNFECRINQFHTRGFLRACWAFQWTPIGAPRSCRASPGQWRHSWAEGHFLASLLGLLRFSWNFKHSDERMQKESPRGSGEDHFSYGSRYNLEVTKIIEKIILQILITSPDLGLGRDHHQNALLRWINDS